MRGVPRVQQTGAAAILCVLCTGPVFAGRQTLECNESGQVPGGRGGTIVAQVVNYAEVAPQAGPPPIALWIGDAAQGPDFIQTRAQAAVRRIHAQRNTTPTPGLPGQRIRTESPILKSLIRDASERSQTFRALVDAIDATDGLVYLGVGRCGRLRACLLHRVTLAGEYRVLTILVNLRPPSTDPTPAIGHEFQHVPRY